MYSQLGNIIFETLLSPTSDIRKSAATYAEHALIEGKPRLQFTGLALNELNLSIRLHAIFCNPVEQLQLFKDAMNNAEALKYISGSKVEQGYYVVTEIEEEIEDADKDGNIFCINANITLKEFDIKDRLAQMQEDNKKNATATGDKKPVTTKKKNPKTCPQAISEIISKISNHGAAVNKTIQEQGGVIYPPNKISLTSHLNFISDYATDIKNRCDNPSSCAYGKTEMKNWAITVDSRAQTMKLSVLNAGDSVGDNTNLQAAINSLKASARSFSNQTVTRK